MTEVIILVLVIMAAMAGIVRGLDKDKPIGIRDVVYSMLVPVYGIFFALMRTLK